MALIVWTIVLWATLGSAVRSPLGPIKWADFVQFYASGHIADVGPMAALYDENVRHDWQVALVPESSADFYTVAYPPLAAWLFLPFSRLTFLTAGWVWAGLSLVLLLGIVRQTSRRQAWDRALVFPAVLAFPPTWQLFLHGQNTILIVLAFALAGLALERGRPIIAGISLGALCLKPQFTAPLILVGLICREWRLLLGFTASVVAQLAATTALWGFDILELYARSLLATGRLATVAEPKPFLQHSMRAMTALLPGMWGSIVLALACGAVSALVIAVWRRTTHPHVRMGTLVLGSVLVNPHVYIYDAVVLVLTGLWLGQSFGSRVDWLWQRAYWIVFAFLLPTAYVLPLQLSVFLLLELLWQVWRRSSRLIAPPLAG